MRFKFTVEVEVERSQGLFATREELAEQMREAIEGADPGQLSGDNGGEYEVSSWEVNEEIEVKVKKPKRDPVVDHPECLHRVRKWTPQTRRGGSEYRYRCTLCGKLQKILNGVDLDALDAQLATKEASQS